MDAPRFFSAQKLIGLNAAAIKLIAVVVVVGIVASMTLLWQPGEEDTRMAGAGTFGPMHTALSESQQELPYFPQSYHRPVVAPLTMPDAADIPQ